MVTFNREIRVSDTRLYCWRLEKQNCFLCTASGAKRLGRIKNKFIPLTTLLLPFNKKSVITALQTIPFRTVLFPSTTRCVSDLNEQGFGK